MSQTGTSTVTSIQTLTPDRITGPGSALSTRGLTKKFSGGQVAVAGIDLDVPQGSVYGFLGPNGSGKTTTIRMLLGLIRPSAGEVALLGQPMPDRAACVLPRVGALVEGPAFYPYLSGWANLARLDAADRTVDGRTSKERIGHALDRVGLAAAARKRYRNYSLGMRQRLGLAGALLRHRDLLVLDEPTNGLDPQGTREVRLLIRELAAEGCTVFVSSHLLTEIEQVCSHVGVMSRGHLVTQGSLSDLRAVATRRIRILADPPDLALSVLHGFGVPEPTLLDGAVVAPIGELDAAEVNAALVHAGARVRELVVEQPTLEDVFVSLTGEGFDVDQ